jgi:hypothetical protein
MSLILSGTEHRSNEFTYRAQPVYASARALVLVLSTGGSAMTSENGSSRIQDCVNEFLSTFASPIFDGRYRTAATE